MLPAVDAAGQDKKQRNSSCQDQDEVFTIPATELRWEATEPSTVALSASPTYGGGVTGGGPYPVGSAPTISAIPKQGWVFLRWRDGMGPPHYTAFFW